MVLIIEAIVYFRLNAKSLVVCFIILIITFLANEFFILIAIYTAILNEKTQTVHLRKNRATFNTHGWNITQSNRIHIISTCKAALPEGI